MKFPIYIIPILISLSLKEAKQERTHEILPKTPKEYIKEYTHTTIVVLNMNKSLEFYVDLLLLTKELDKTLEGEEIDKLYGITGGIVRIVRLSAKARIPSFVSLELIQFISHPGHNIDHHMLQLGYQHICYYVRNITELYDELTASGYKGISPPIEVFPTLTIVFVYDPDHIMVELYQINATNGGMLSSSSVPPETNVMFYHHTGYTTIQNEELLKFYVDNLGLTLNDSANYTGAALSTAFGFSELTLWEMDAYPQCNLTSMHFELLKFVGKDVRPVGTHRIFDSMISHVGFRVTDIQKVYDIMKNQSVFLSPPVLINTLKEKKALMQDIEGNLIEFVEVITEPKGGEGDDGLGNGWIIGLSVGGSLVIIVAIFEIYYWKCRKQKTDTFI